MDECKQCRLSKFYKPFALHVWSMLFPRLLMTLLLAVEAQVRCQFHLLQDEISQPYSHSQSAVYNLMVQNGTNKLLNILKGSTFHLSFSWQSRSTAFALACSWLIISIIRNYMNSYVSYFVSNIYCSCKSCISSASCSKCASNSVCLVPPILSSIHTRHRASGPAEGERLEGLQLLVFWKL